MNASKENCRKAKEIYDRNKPVDTADADFMDKFFNAAEDKLPMEKSFARDRQKKRKLATSAK